MAQVPLSGLQVPQYQFAKSRGDVSANVGGNNYKTHEYTSQALQTPHFACILNDAAYARKFVIVGDSSV
jgi:hypothetical protein